MAVETLSGTPFCFIIDRLQKKDRKHGRKHGYQRRPMTTIERITINSLNAAFMDFVLDTLCQVCLRFAWGLCLVSLLAEKENFFEVWFCSGTPIANVSDL